MIYHAIERYMCYSDMGSSYSAPGKGHVFRQSIARVGGVGGAFWKADDGKKTVGPVLANVDWRTDVKGGETILRSAHAGL